MVSHRLPGNKPFACQSNGEFLNPTGSECISRNVLTAVKSTQFFDIDGHRQATNIGAALQVRNHRLMTVAVTHISFVMETKKAVRNKFRTAREDWPSNCFDDQQ